MTLHATHERSIVPQYFAERYPQLYALIETYYQWLDTVAPNDIESTRNIDTVEGQYVDLLLAEITNSFPLTPTVDKVLVGRHARDIFRARGTTQAIEALFRLFLNVDAHVNLPGKYVFTPSADKYSKTYQIEVSDYASVVPAVGKSIRTTSGGTFTLVDIIVRTINNRYHNIAVVTDIVDPINIGDNLVVGGRVTPSVIAGSLADVTITRQYGYGYKGQPVQIVGETLGEGEGIVSSVIETQSSVVINSISGGSGYTGTPQVVLSDFVVGVANDSPFANTINLNLKQTLYKVVVDDTSFVAGANINLLQYSGNTVTSNVAATVVALKPSVSTLGDLIVTTSSPAINVTSSTSVVSGNASSNCVATNVSANGTIISVAGGGIATTSTTNQFYPGAPVTCGANSSLVLTVDHFINPTVGTLTIGATVPVLTANATDSAFIAANTQHINVSSTSYRQAFVGSIDQFDLNFNLPTNITTVTYGPVAVVSQPLSANGQSVVALQVGSAFNYVGGETITQRAQTANTKIVTVDSSSGIKVGDLLVSPTLVSPTYISIVREVSGTQLGVDVSQGSIGNGDVVVNVRTTLSATASNVVSGSTLVAAGRIEQINGNILTIRTTGGTFANTGTITGQISQISTGVVTANTIDTFAGYNFNAASVVIPEQQVITGVTVTKCGVGITQPQVVSVVDSDNNLIADGYATVAPIGVSDAEQSIVQSGVSNFSKLQDSDYRQYHSYEITSPLSFDTYKGIVDKYVHLSGSRMFGSVAIIDNKSVPVTVSETIVISA